MELDNVVKNEQLSRSPKKEPTNVELLTGTMRSLAMLNRNGTTKLFTPEQLYNKAMQYIEHCKNNPIQSNQLITGGNKGGDIIPVSKPRMLTIEGLCTSLGVNTKYLNDLEYSIKGKDDIDSKLYSEVILYIRDIIRAQRFELAAVNEFNSMFVAKLEGLTDKVEHSGQIDNTVTQITFIQKSIEDVNCIEVESLMIDAK